AAVVAGRADQFDRHPGLDGLHDRLVEAVQVVGEHAGRRLLVGAHRRGLFFGTFLDLRPDVHGCSPGLCSVGYSAAGRNSAFSVALNWSCSVDSFIAVVDDLPPEIAIDTASK